MRLFVKIWQTITNIPGTGFHSSRNSGDGKAGKLFKKTARPFCVIAPIMFFAMSNMGMVHGEIINIEIKDKVTLPEKQMVLGDIAYVSCNDPSLLERINNVFIGNTPWPGNIRRIEKDIIAARLADEGLELKAIVFGSATSSLVSVESVAVKGEEILKKAKDYLLAKLSRSEGEIIIETDRPPADKLLPATEGDVRFEISQIDANKDRGDVQLVVRIFINDKQYSKIPVFFTIRVYEDVVVAKRKIDRNGILSDDDLLVKRLETTRLGSLTYGSIEELEGKRAVRFIQPNSPITQDIVDNPPVMKKGDVVKVLIQANNFSVTAKGVAKEDGFLGKVIKVKNIDSNKELYGTVENSDTVRILF